MIKIILEVYFKELKANQVLGLIIFFFKKIYDKVRELISNEVYVDVY